MEETLFAWVHISDIHFGHGDAGHRWDQRLVLERLRLDLGEAMKLGAPQPDAILVTGDIAFSGGGRSPDEYVKAEAWLRGVGATVGLGPQQIFVIPGNHDANRKVDAQPEVVFLVDGLRSGKSLDAALADPADARALTKRMEGYLTFAKAFAPACVRADEPDEQRLFWVHSIEARGGLRVRLAGLNTALLAKDHTDQGKLQLGKKQLDKALLPSPAEGEIVVVLTHHPLREWLADGKRVDEWIASGAHVHLFGHVHEAGSEEARRGAGTRFVRVTAGAAHAEQESNDWVPASHGYNFAAVVRGDGNKLELRVWPRRWAETPKAFRVDTDAVGDGESFAEHEIPRVTLPGAPAARAPRAPSLPSKGGLRVFFSYAPEDEDLRRALEKHLTLLKRTGTIERFATRAVAGEEWRRVVDKDLEAAHVILLLLSPDYLVSDYCYDVEMETARRRYEAGEAIVIPVWLRELELAQLDVTTREPLWFERLVRIPHDTQPGEGSLNGKPITSWSNRDAAWAQVARELRETIERLRRPG